MADAKIEVTYAIDAAMSEEIARLRAALEAAEQERDALAAPMPCGHAARYAFGVSECVMCHLGSALEARDAAREEFRLENLAYHKAADRAMAAERERDLWRDAAVHESASADDLAQMQRRADALAAELAQVRDGERAAYERAAQVCDRVAGKYMDWSKRAAAEIRALAALLPAPKEGE